MCVYLRGHSPGCMSHLSEGRGLMEEVWMQDVVSGMALSLGERARPLGIGETRAG